ncbi:MAG: hypothetical protein IPL86_17270 [Flavobacteriales bacterium]|nr:hypothetical protein [Flavobacteriales bacterium]
MTHEKLTNALAFKALHIHRLLLLALALQTQCSKWLSTTSAQHFHRSSKKPTSSQTQFRRQANLLGSSHTNCSSLAFALQNTNTNDQIAFAPSARANHKPAPKPQSKAEPQNKG